MGLEPGARALGRYVVEGVLGEGGMGQVYRGRHESLGFAVALKLLTETKDKGLAARFEREAKLMARVRHPNVVSILDYGFLEDGSPCIAMELVEGEPLDKRLDRVGAVPWATAVEWMLGILGGLDAMHSASVLHRDLKPANLVIAPGAPELAKIIDFGIARPTWAGSTQLTQEGGFIGTPAYMSPEQLMGYEMDERSDLYSAGLIFYEMVTADRPGRAESVTSLIQRIHRPIPTPRAPASMPSVPPAIQDLILAPLALAAVGRPRTAREYMERLKAAWAAATAAMAVPSIPPGGSAAEELATRAPRGERGLAERSAEPTRARSRPPGGSAEPLQVEPSPPVADAEEPELRRYLVAAKLPPSRLSSREERRWLASLASASGRGYTLGAQLWFVWQRAGTTEEAARAEAQGIASALEERYGATARIAWSVVDEQFAITPAALSGAVSLPDALGSLIDEVSA